LYVFRTIGAKRASLKGLLVIEERSRKARKSLDFTLEA
jgi:hypothetical protein